MAQFEGVMVGGPEAGRWHASNNEWTRMAHVQPLATLPARSADSAALEAVMTYTDYRWWHGVWVEMDLHNSGPEAIIKELASGYHPATS